MTVSIATLVPALPSNGSITVVLAPAEPRGFGRRREYCNWVPLPDKQGTAFAAEDSTTNEQVEIRFLPHLNGDEALKSELKRLVQQIQGSGEEIARPIIEDRTDDAVPQLVLKRCAGVPLTEYLTAATATEHLQIAADIAFKLDKAHGRGLYHGCLLSSSILVMAGNGLCCSIDFAERFYREQSIQQVAPEQHYHQDAIRCVEVINEIAASLLGNSNAINEIAPRKLAVIKRLHRETAVAENGDKSLEMWIDALREWCPALQATPVRDFLDHNAGSGTREVPSIHHYTPPQNLASDRTGEVSVLMPPSSNAFAKPIKDEGTDEVAFEYDAKAGLARRAVSVGESLGRFRLDSILGRGGMGIVFRGTDSSTGGEVAVKVLQCNGSDIEHAVRRFNKEARILANVQNEFVTALLDVGHDRGHHYIAMEYVDGTNLKDWMQDKLPLPENDALQLTADIAKALIQAHSKQIIHRDIKPENILLARSKDPKQELPPRLQPLEQLGVKLTDFGIARHINQSSSMEVTRAGAMLGTPLYMSPEQCKGNNAVGPAADIYALGITLYEMLSGEPPFQSDDAMKLAAMQCFDPLPDLQRRNRAVSDRVAGIVNKMLAKTAEDRYADASQLYSDLERCLSGATTDFEAHPNLPAFDANRIWERVFSWELQSTPNQLWPFVSDTDRLNRAAGLPSVTYRNEKDPVRGLRKFGSFKLGGIKIAWEEHPFEWIEGKRMGVLREFSSGPFKWFMNTVELVPLASGGTRLVHTVKIEPRNTLGRIVSTIEAGWKGGKALDRIYHRIDSYLQTKGSEEALVDAFEESSKLPLTKSSRVEQRLDAMVQGGVSIDIAQKICDFVKSASPQAIAKIRPLSLAHQWSVEPMEMLDACLVAARCGLLRLQWDILCPTCRVAASSEPILSKISQHTECEACDVEFQSNIGNAIEMVFSVHPEIREIEEAKYCVGGPGHSPHVVSQLRLQPGERMEVQLSMAIGDYIVRSTSQTNQQAFRVRSSAAPSHLELDISTLGLGKHVPTVLMGQLTLVITNDQANVQLVRVERTVNRDDVFTAAAASAHPRFRELFPEQTFHRNLPVTTEELSLFAVEINNVDLLYSSLGDSDAYERIQRFLGKVEQTIGLFRGAVVKSVGEGLLVSFQDGTAAVQAALAVQKLKAEDRDFEIFDVGIGIHRGRTLISTQNGRLDYFGQTARLVTQLAKRAGAALLLSDTVFSDSCTHQILQNETCEREVTELSIAGFPTQLVQRIVI
jgi:serine/threonine protein kinase/class 3 adenylate cyclase